MKKLAVVLFIAVAGLAAYFLMSPPPPSPVARLSLFIDEHVDSILGPLPSGGRAALPVAPPSHTLRILREDIQDHQKAAPPSQSLKYSTATQLCDLLLQASESRDRHLARLNDTRAKNNLSPLAPNPRQHAAERLRYFENGIVLSWQQTASKFRAAIDRKYAQLRELERK